MMTAKDACALLGISRSTLNRRVQSGKIKPLNRKTPGQERIPAYLFDRADVERLVLVDTEVEAQQQEAVCLDDK